MKPAGKVRCNIVPIAKGYDRVSLPVVLEAPARPGLSLLSWYRRAPIFLSLKSTIS